MAGVKLGLFLRIESLARRRDRLVFLVTIAICLFSLLLGRNLTLDGDVLNLVPKNNRVISTFREALKDFGSPIEALRFYRRLQEVDLSRKPGD